MTSQNDSNNSLPSSPVKELVDEISMQCIHLGTLQGAKEELEEDLKKVNIQISKLEEETIPQMMLNAGLEEITTDDGKKVTLKRDYFPHVSEANKETFFQWLRENDLEAIIKTEFKSSLSKGDQENTDRILELIKEEHLEELFSMKEAVHPQTLKAFVKEKMEEGASLPESINVHVKEKVILNG